MPKVVASKGGKMTTLFTSYTSPFTVFFAPRLKPLKESPLLSDGNRFWTGCVRLWTRSAFSAGFLAHHPYQHPHGYSLFLFKSANCQPLLLESGYLWLGIFINWYYGSHMVMLIVVKKWCIESRHSCHLSKSIIISWNVSKIAWTSYRDFRTGTRRPDFCYS